MSVPAITMMILFLGFCGGLFFILINKAFNNKA